jgi:hypothetical protein
MDEILIGALAALFGAYLSVTAFNGLRGGVVHYGFGLLIFHRSQNPIAFWMAIVSKLLGVLCILGFAAMSVAAPNSLWAG